MQIHGQIFDVDLFRFAVSLIAKMWFDPQFCEYITLFIE